MPGRKFNSSEYRYGFNGKEKDDDGEFGSITNYDYGFRIYNPAVGKFLSVDPLTREYPWYTPYQFAGNAPIVARDLDGAEPESMVTWQIERDNKAYLKGQITEKEYYDRAKARLFGGTVGLGVVLVWEGGAWALANPATAMELARDGGFIVSEALTEQTLIFGGSSAVIGALASELKGVGRFFKGMAVNVRKGECNCSFTAETVAHILNNPNRGPASALGDDFLGPLIRTDVYDLTQVHKVIAKFNEEFGSQKFNFANLGNLWKYLELDRVKIGDHFVITVDPVDPKKVGHAFNVLKAKDGIKILDGQLESEFTKGSRGFADYVEWLIKEGGGLKNVRVWEATEVKN